MSPSTQEGSRKSEAAFCSVWRKAHLFAFQPTRGWMLLKDAALVSEGAWIRWIGPDQDLPAGLSVQREYNLEGALLGPGLIDAHTHLIYAGDRAGEFEARLQGSSYAEIARNGGGIRASVTATRAASEAALFDQALKRARGFMAEGVTTLEIKSGYGLSEEHEARCLSVARRLGQTLDLAVRTTSLGAHAIPEEYAGRGDAYIDAVCTWLPRQHAEGLIDAVDAFCDTIAFTLEQIRRVFQTAQRLRLPVKLHAEQLSNQGGAVLASAFQALSCDHLEHLDQVGVQAMKRSGTVAVLLPGAYYFMRETQLPPVAALLEAEVPIAVASDHNPGTSPANSLVLMLNMASTLFRLTPEQAWRGVTVNAARALGLADRGNLQPGLRADLAVWDADHPRELVYRFGHQACKGSYFGGVPRLLK
jgi:imidazolonepropionase